MNNHSKFNYRHVAIIAIFFLIVSVIVLIIDNGGNNQNYFTIIYTVIAVTVGCFFIIQGLFEALTFIKLNKKYPWYLIYQIIMGVFVLAVVVYVGIKMIF